MSTIQVPITKAGKGVFLPVNTDDPENGGDLPANVYAEALLIGLTKLIGESRMTKVYKAKLAGAELAEMQEAVLVRAKENLEMLRKGDLKKRAKASDGKVSGVVMTEAMRLARNIVKDEMKRQGIKVSYVAASDITKAAKALIEETPELIDQAKASVAERERVVSQGGAIVGTLKALATNLPISSEKKAKAEKAAADKKAKAPLSAKQAGKTKKHKPQAAATA